MVIVGDDPASHVYVRSKVKACERLGLKSTHVERPATTSQEDLEAIVDELNADASVHGILGQSPLPPHLDEGAITDRIEIANGRPAAREREGDPRAVQERGASSLIKIAS